MSRIIDLRSDTVTQPSRAMREAMANATVGDDVLDGDPTVRTLELRVAELLGKEAGLFFPTGSMANVAAVWLHTSPGTEMLVDADSHILRGEMAAAAALCGVQPRAVRATPLFDADALREAILPPSIDDPELSLVCMENTHNSAGGQVLPLDAMRGIANVARDVGVAVHLDGARLWNASAATGMSLSDFASCADTVMVSFSKALGAPVGAALVGTKAHMVRAHRIRKRLGGGMRQSGVIAACGLYGLEHNLARITEDHVAARDFAAIVDGAGGARVVPPETNIVMIDLPSRSASEVVTRAHEVGVRVLEWTPTRIRAVMHLDVSISEVRYAAQRLAEVLDASEPSGR